MADFILGLLAIIAGLIFCFSGQFVLRLTIPIWGFFAGFAFGGGLISSITGDGFLSTVLGWVVGFVFALIFAVFSYLYYAVAIVLAMAAAGFALGAGIVVALGIDWNWIAVLVGVALGAVLAFAAIAIDAPTIVLVVVSAMGGAVAVVTGLMLLFGAVNSDDFTRGEFTSRIQDDWWWYLLYLFIAVMGVFSQTRDIAVVRRSMRDSWTASLQAESRNQT